MSFFTDKILDEFQENPQLLERMLEDKSSQIDMSGDKGDQLLRSVIKIGIGAHVDNYKKSKANIEFVKLLIKNGVNVNQNADDSPLFLAIHSYNTFNYNRYNRDITHFPVNQDSYFEVIKLLIENGADVNMEYRSTTPLIQAVSENFRDIKLIELLIEKGADVNKMSEGGRLPIVKAVDHHFPDIDIVKLLIEKGADVNKTDTYADMTAFKAASLNKPDIRRKPTQDDIIKFISPLNRIYV